MYLQAFLLYTDPEGKRVFTDSQPTTTHFTISHHTTQDTPSLLTIPDIKARIAELQKQLASLEVYNIIVFINLTVGLIIIYSFPQKSDWTQAEENGNHFSKIPL